jgi:putative ABC transport system permease protein
MSAYLRIAGRNLVQSHRRTALLGGALALVTALLVLLMSLSAGISDTMIRVATTLSAGHVNVAGFYKVGPNEVGAAVFGAQAVREKVEAITPGLDYVVSRQRGWGRVVGIDGSIQCGITGLEPAKEARFFDALRLAAESEYKEGGRAETFGDPREVSEPNRIVLFAGQAKRLGVVVGDPVTVTIETFGGMTNSAEFVVAAVARDMGMMTSWQTVTSADSVRRLYDMKEDATGVIQVYLRDPTMAESVLGTLREGLAADFQLMDHDGNPFFMKFDRVLAEDWVGQKLDLTTWRDEVSFLTWIVTALDAISFFLTFVLLLIIAAGIANAMTIAVRSRTAEVGTIRAIGMRRGQVLNLFLIEALLLGLGATGVGALVGVGLALGIDAAAIEVPVEAMQAILLSDTLHLSVRPGAVLGAVVGFTLVSGLAALGPAYRASRLQPVTAIHHIA